ncbi:large proline-rich protein BAG6 [Anopheles ziemanni]|uniref:large proline-rich protein BAG6 n=1 Tax=Anopheles ziemanni TaxID=345580 RepID=UPI00265ED970|nr:large proline-rich protein BAG6 [Anopheles ziemanni]
MINLKVKTLDSQNHDFAVDDEITVRQFKEQIAQRINVSVELQRLIYCGRVLADDRALKDYDVNGKVVHLVQRAPPSARGTSLSGGADAGGRGSDEATRASRRSRSSDNASRNAGFRGFEGQGNLFRGFDGLDTMYFGSMTSIPLNVSATNVTQIPSVSSSSTLCNNRITVARHMLDCADSILSYLENPSLGLNYSAMDYLSQQTMESTVFEVGISAVGDMEVPHSQMQNFVNAFQGAVSAAFRQNGMSNVTVQQPDGLNGSVQVFGTVPDFAVLTPPNTSATATPAHEGSGTSSASSSSRSSSNASSSSSSSSSSRAGTGGSSSSSSSTSSSTSSSESSAESRRQARPGPSNNQTTSTQTLGEVVQHMRNVQRRMEPFMQQYLDILQDDPPFEESDTVGRENAQRVFDRVSEAMHYMSHAQHAISDLMLDLQMATPRHLCCRPILVEQNAYVSSGMAAVPHNINLASLLRNNMNNNNNNNTNNNNNPEVGNNNVSTPVINIGITPQPAFFTGVSSGGGSPATSMRPPSSAAVGGGGGGGGGGNATAAPGGPGTTTTTSSASQSQQQQQHQQAPTIGQSTTPTPSRPHGGSRDDDIVTSVYIPLYDMDSVRAVQNILGEMPPPAAGRRDNPVVLVRDLLLPRAPRTASADGRLQPPSSGAGANNPQTRNQPTANINSAAAAGAAATTGRAPANNNSTGASAGNAANAAQFQNNNTHMQVARLIQAVVNAAPILSDIHVQINTTGGPGGNQGGAGSNPIGRTPPEAPTTGASAPPQGGNPTNTTTTNTNSNGGTATAGAAAGGGGGGAGPTVMEAAGLAFVPRFATVTLPTTSTQTRSTSRPHVHSIPPPAASHIRNLRPVPTNILSTFDRFLPCNSHHIRDATAAAAATSATPSLASNEQASEGNSAAAGATAPSAPESPEDFDMAFAREMFGPSPVTLLGSHFDLSDFFNLVPSANTFNRVRDSLQTYVSQTLFSGRPWDDQASIREVTNEIIERMLPVLAQVTQHDRTQYDTRASLANLVRNAFPTCLTMIRQTRTPYYGVQLARFLAEVVRRFFMILVVGVGRTNARTIVTDLLRNTLQQSQLSDSDFAMLLQPTIDRYLDGASRGHIVEIDSFLVIRLPGPPSAGDAAVSELTPAAADVVVPEFQICPLVDAAGEGGSRSSSMSSSTGTGQRESSPMDVDDMETTSTPELVSDIAEISISIEPPVMNVDQCAAIVITTSPPSVDSSSSSASVSASAANAPERQQQQQQSGDGQTTASATSNASEKPALGTMAAATAAVTLRAASLAEPPVPPPRPTDDDEEMPTVNIGAESWHRHFPSNWIPVISRDLGRQRRQNPQAPFSDAYISSMSSKRRKVITESKPPNDVHSLISDGIRRSFLGTGITPTCTGSSTTGGASGRLRTADTSSTSNASMAAASSSSGGDGGSIRAAAGGTPANVGNASGNRFRTLDELANSIANDGALQMSYCEAMRASIRERLAKDPDYDATRFPNCSKFFEKQ